MTIQWFPGHMAKARRQIEEKLKLIDVVYELLDARLPMSSRNPMIDQILEKKPRVVLLNKADLADPSVTSKWADVFKQQGHQALAVDSTTGARIGDIAAAGLELMSKKRQADRDRGVNPRAVRGLIVGIPNVGKSTLINRMAGRQIALTGDRPGVTKQQQWIKTAHELELLDTPGILWPKFEDPQVGVRLAATGAIKDDILNIEEVAFQTMKLLLARYPEQLLERYKLTALPEDLEDPVQVVEAMEGIGRLRGCLLSGGRIDLEKTAMVILRDLRSGKLGRITLEQPDTV